MGKLIFLTLMLLPPLLYADTDVSQFSLSLIDHVFAGEEFNSNGNIKTEILDSYLQMDKYKDNYLIALDAGLMDNSNKPGRLAGTFGVHIHLVSFIRNCLGANLPTLNWIDFTPRISYDADIHRGVIGITLGAQIPFGENK